MFYLYFYQQAILVRLFLEQALDFYGYLQFQPRVELVAHLFGTKYLGMLYGIVFKSSEGSFFGAYLGGLFYDLYGSYDYAWYLAIALSIFAGLIHLPIREQAVDRLQKA